MCLGPLCPLPRHFPLKTSDLYHVLVVQVLRVAHLCVYPETVLDSVVLNLSGMALGSEEVFCQKRPSEGCRRSRITHGPWGQGRVGESQARLFPGVPSLRAACALDSANSPTPLRRVRLQESQRTKRLCDFCFESGL